MEEPEVNATLYSLIAWPVYKIQTDGHFRSINYINQGHLLLYIIHIIHLPCTSSKPVSQNLKGVRSEGFVFPMVVEAIFSDRIA